jgi:hypothetical protein
MLAVSNDFKRIMWRFTEQHIKHDEDKIEIEEKNMILVSNFDFFESII